MADDHHLARDRAKQVQDNRRVRADFEIVPKFLHRTPTSMLGGTSSSPGWRMFQFSIKQIHHIEFSMIEGPRYRPTSGTTLCGKVFQRVFDYSI
jgi:hypothetical protein